MEVIQTEKAPAAIGPYSQALKVGNMLFVSGQIPVNPSSGEMPESIEEQAAQSLRNLENILAEAGFTLSNVVKTTVFLTDLNDFTVVNDIYATFFNAPYPTRSCVQVADIPKGAKVEIECIAIQ